MSKTTRNILIALAVLLVLVLAVTAVYRLNAPTPVEGSKTVTLEIIHADGSQKTVTMHTDSENLLGALQEQEGLIEGEGEGSMFYVTTVDGETADWDTDQAFWSFTKDGEWLDTGAADTMIQDGDHFEFTYTISTW